LVQLVRSSPSARLGAFAPSLAATHAVQGGIGQPLSLLMKMNPLVGHLSLYDMVGTPGVATDLSHMNTKAKVTVRALREQCCASAWTRAPARLRAVQG